MASGLRRAVHYQAYRKVGCLNRKRLEIAYTIILTRVISPHKWWFAERKEGDHTSQPPSQRECRSLAHAVACL